MGRKPRHARLKRGGPAVAFAITSGYQSWVHWDLVSILWPPPGALIFVLPATGRSRSSQPFLQGFAYLVTIGVAFLCYYLGPR